MVEDTPGHEGLVVFQGSKGIESTLAEKAPDQKLALEVKNTSGEHRIPDEAESTTGSQAPVTASLLRCRNRLKEQGLLSTYYAALLHVAQRGLIFLLVSRSARFVGFVDPSIRSSVAALLATMLCAPLSLMWTHLLISRPSPGRWRRLIPTYRMLVNVAPATAVWALADHVTAAMPVALFQKVRLAEQVTAWTLGLVKPTRQDVDRVILSVLGVITVIGLAFVLVYVPATVTLRRVQASMLPETEEPLVSFDRSFDGRFLSRADGGSGKLGMLDAWRSYNGAARWRLLKIYALALGLEMHFLLMLGLSLAGPFMMMLRHQEDASP